MDNETQIPTALDELTVRELVAVRLMLEEALSRARTAGRYSRGSAVVGLDAVVERVTYTVAVRRETNLGSRSTLPDVYSKLVESFAGSWRSSVWSAINKLHVERNKIQHQGLEPDRDQLPAWIQAVESYVVALIEAQYSLDIRRIVLADALDDDLLADLVRQADRALAIGDVRASVEASLNAYDAAVSRWVKMHSNPYRPPVRSFEANFGRVGSSDHQDREIESLRRQSAESSFAPSRAEQDWLSAARRETREVLDEDDAERILNFVFSWIASFEVAAREWVPDRRHRADVAARRQRKDPAAPASVAEVRSIDQHSPLRYETQFVLDDVPGESEYRRWADTLRSLLTGEPAGHGISFWRVNGDGTVNLSTDDNPPGADHLNALADAVERVELAITEQDQAVAQKAAALKKETAQKEAAIAAAQDQLPFWIDSVVWEPNGRLGGGPSWTLTLSNLTSRHTSPNLSGDSAQMEIAKALREHELVQQCYGNGETTLSLEPGLDLSDLLVVLASANEAAVGHLAKANDNIEQHRAAVAEATAELAKALASRRR